MARLIAKNYHCFKDDLASAELTEVSGPLTLKVFA
jgi:hypothetical protein